MTFEEIKKELSKKNYKPIYFLSGEEPFFIDLLTDYMEQNILAEEDKAFNQTILYGNDINAAAIIDSARRFPMMSDKQVVIVKEAQYIRDIDTLLPYVSHYQPSTILVIAYKGAPDKRKALFKTLNSTPHCGCLDSKKLYDNKIPDWIVRYCKAKERNISMKAAGIIANNLGTELSKVVNELDKLMLIIPKQGNITEEHIEEHIGISKDFNVFELISAMSKKDFLRTGLIVNYFIANPKRNPMQLVFGMLFRYYNTLLTYHYQKRSATNIEQLAKELGINPYYIKDYSVGASHYSARKCADAIALIRLYDMKSKGQGNAGTDGGELLKELIFRLMH
ncbi:MAG: DNA polymerase III subunit delta [Marinifilaceae bacterium]